MPTIHFRKLRFIYCASEPFAKNKERIEKFKEIGNYDIFIKIN